MEFKSIKIQIEYNFFPLTVHSVIKSKKIEEERGEPGIKQDYVKLLKLKTSNYLKLSTAEFNKKLPIFNKENPDTMDRISGDIMWNDFKVELTKDELSFVKQTILFSRIENIAYINTQNTGTKVIPVLGSYEQYKSINNNERFASTLLDYWISYDIIDNNMLIQE